MWTGRTRGPGVTESTTNAPWRTLTGRLVLASLTGVTVAAILFMVVSSGFVRAAADETARNELDRQALAVGRFISDEVEEDVQAGREASVPQRIVNLERLVGPQAVVYYDGGKITPGGAAESNLPELAEEKLDYGVLAVDGLQRIDFRLPGSDRRVEGTAVPIEVGGATIGAALIARPPRSFDPEFGSVINQIIIAAGLGLLVALALSLYLTSRMLRPLRAMQAATRRVAEGDMRHQLGPTGTRELDELSSAFNRMVGRLAERERLTRDFLMKVTHDLRTPLTAIKGHSVAILDGVVPEPEVPRSLSAIEGEASRLETMVSDLLDLAKIDAHTFRVELDVVEPAEVLESAFDAFTATAAEQGVLYQSNIAALHPITTDPTRMQQIVSNLLENALRWTSEDGIVRLDARPAADGGVVASISDTGPGIPPEDLDSIFEPFQSNETPSGKHGSGLGLAISRQLARTLGGDITVESRLGEGASFALELPVAAPEDAETTDRD